MFNAITGGFIADEGSIVLGRITFAPRVQRSSKSSATRSRTPQGHGPQ